MNKNEEVRIARTGSISYEEIQRKKFQERLARYASNDGDTNSRWKIQNEITEGLDKIDKKIKENPEINRNEELEKLIKNLKNKPEYQRYIQYISIWVENKADKRQQSNKGNELEIE